MSEESYGITVLTGGVGPEREVSIASGTALTERQISLIWKFFPIPLFV